jgi:hypothetical protein
MRTTILISAIIIASSINDEKLGENGLMVAIAFAFCFMADMYNFKKR